MSRRKWILDDRSMWRVVVVSLVVCFLNAGCQSESADQSDDQQPTSVQTAESRASSPLLPEDGPTEKDYPALHNLLKINQRFYSGGEPRGEEAFKQLADLGVKVVVSVDGARPDVQAAARHGLRYVHIPIGYDGVSGEAGKSLARLVQELSGPFYIHCHHGTHRGPAAAAVACVASGATDGRGALAILEKAGTGKHYAGLWRDVAGYRPPENSADLPELVATAEVDSIAAAMAQADRGFDNLKLCRDARWSVPANHPDLVPAQEALHVREALHEMGRRVMEDTSSQYDTQLRTWLAESEALAGRLEQALRDGHMDAATRLMSKMEASCKQCHAKYRNN